MWKATVGHQVHQNIQNDDADDWETDPDFVNDINEIDQRWGSKTIEGSGRTAGAINMQELRSEIEKSDTDIKKKQLESVNPHYGYGGKYGIQKDRMDKSAVGHDYIGKTEKHASQKDYSEGFGGKFGVQKDRVDKSALSWEHKEKLEKHSSQKDYATGFGGKFGVQSDRVDKSAVGWDHVEKVEKHESQKDYAKGFGGKFGIQEDRKDSSAVGWDYVQTTEKHESQLDHKKGFGGKFGVQSDRMDKSAIGFDDQKERIGTNYSKTKPDIGAAKPSNLRAKFENFAQNAEEEVRKATAKQKLLREEKDQLDRERATKQNLEQSNHKSEDNETNKKDPIKTGRQGSIGNAISAFNQIQTKSNEPVTPRKEPIKIDRSGPEDSNHYIVSPDVVSQTETITETEQITNKEQSEENIVAPPTQFNENENTVDNEPIYQNQEDISEYIEDTGMKAIALYDYQAAADDEISFDPDDIITHIEMIDEGWWRGLCRNHYGLFPANYVQLQSETSNN